MRQVAKYYVLSPKTQPFSPLDLSPALWLDASDTATITASLGSVSQWDDKSGNGRNVTQGTAAAQPTTGASTLNGLNVLNFDGGDRLNSVEAAATWKFLHDGTEHVIAAVWRPGNSDNPNVSYGLLGTSVATSGNVGFTVLFVDGAGANNNSAAHYVNRGVSGDFAVLNSTGADTLVANTWSVMTLLGDPDNATAATRSQVFFGSGSAIANNTRTLSVSSADPTYNLQIGSAGNNQIVLVGSVAELIIVSGANATEANRIKVRDYLTAKWGL
jgi:hypothetical protein